MKKIVLITLSILSVCVHADEKGKAKPSEDGYEIDMTDKFKGLDHPADKPRFKVSGSCKTKFGMTYNAGSPGYDECMQEAQSQPDGVSGKSASPTIDNIGFETKD